MAGIRKIINVANEFIGAGKNATDALIDSMFDLSTNDPLSKTLQSISMQFYDRETYGYFLELNKSKSLPFHGLIELKYAMSSYSYRLAETLNLDLDDIELKTLVRALTEKMLDLSTAKRYLPILETCDCRVETLWRGNPADGSESQYVSSKKYNLTKQCVYGYGEHAKQCYAYPDVSPMVNPHTEQYANTAKVFKHNLYGNDFTQLQQMMILPKTNIQKTIASIINDYMSILKFKSVKSEFILPNHGIENIDDNDEWKTILINLIGK